MTDAAMYLPVSLIGQKPLVPKTPSAHLAPYEAAVLCDYDWPLGDKESANH